jgi:glycosyltransferase involved in cell wall biosynthesis
MSQPRIAVVTDWLQDYSGAERVLEHILDTFPGSDLFAVVDFVPEAHRHFLRGRVPNTTFIQRLPWAKSQYRNYLVLMPLAIEQLDLSGYDIVISSSHAVAKGVLTGPHQLHISYVHSPIRYAWDLHHQYLQESNLERGVKSVIARCILHYMRIWDLRTSPGVDEFVANSGFIAKRIQKVYRRDATVIYPPVDVERFAMRADKSDFYVCAGRMVAYKRVPLLVEAFARMPDKKLVLIGEGPDFERVKANCPGNVELKGFLPIEQVVDYMQRARAMVFAAEEDFGIAPVEAQACGTPVIAYGRGGSLETVIPSGDAATGVFFMEQTADAICEAVKSFEAQAGKISPEACRHHAEQFSVSAFKTRMASFVEARWRASTMQPLAPVWSASRG